MSAENLLAVLARELRLLAEPVVEASGSPAAVYRLLGRMGWSIEEIFGAAVGPVESAARALISRFEALISSEPDNLAEMIALLEDFREAFKSLDEVRKAVTDAAVPDISDEVAAQLLTDLLHYLVIRYLDRRSRPLVQALILLTLIEPQQPEPLRAQGATGRLIRLPRERAILRLDNLPRLMSDPVGHLKTAYIPTGGVATDEAAEEVAKRLFRRMRNLIAAIGGTAFSGLDGGAPTEIALPENAPLRRSLTVSFGGQESIDPDTLEIVARGLFAITGEIVPANAQGAPGRSGPGLKVTPFG